MDLSFRIIRDVCDSIFILSSQGGSAVVLAVFGIWWISLQHPLDFRSSNLDQICDIFMSVRVTSDYDPVLSYFRTITTFQ